MLSKIQKKPLAFRKKLLIGFIIAATVIILPIWVLNIKNIFQNSQEGTKRDASQNKSQETYDWEESKDELTGILQEFRKTIQAIKDQFDMEETKSETEINNSQILTLPDE